MFIWLISHLLLTTGGLHRMHATCTEIIYKDSGSQRSYRNVTTPTEQIKVATNYDDVLIDGPFLKGGGY